MLDQINQRWDESRMGSLTKKRSDSAVATLNNIGVFIIGGGHQARTSDFLPAGQMQWQEGPAVPVDMWYPCAVTITNTSFLSIYGTVIREFDAAIAGPTSSSGWREAGRWPSLGSYRDNSPGCAKVGQKVIIAGGNSKTGGSLKSTEVLDLATHSLASGGEMATARTWFLLVTIISGGEEELFALAGSDDSSNFNSVEEWVEETSRWKAADNLVKKTHAYGAVAVPRQFICPV